MFSQSSNYSGARRGAANGSYFEPTFLYGRYSSPHGKDHTTRSYHAAPQPRPRPRPSKRPAEPEPEPENSKAEVVHEQESPKKSYRPEDWCWEVRPDDEPFVDADGELQTDSGEGLNGCFWGPAPLPPEPESEQSQPEPLHASGGLTQRDSYLFDESAKYFERFGPPLHAKRGNRR